MNYEKLQKAWFPPKGELVRRPKTVPGSFSIVRHKHAGLVRLWCAFVLSNRKYHCIGVGPDGDAAMFDLLVQMEDTYRRVMSENGVYVPAEDDPVG